MLNKRLGMKFHAEDNPIGGLGGEPDPQGSQEPADTNAGGEDNTPQGRNVSREEMQAEIGDLKQTIEDFIASQQKPEAPQANSEKPDELSEIKAALAASKHTEQLGLVRSAGEKAGRNYDALSEFLVGEDTKATTANVDAFNSWLEEHDAAVKQSVVKSTDNGFDATKGKEIKNPSDYLGKMLDSQFGPKVTN